MEIGERWAYRAHSIDSLAEVRVERIGEKRPLRVKVAFLGDEYEGRIDWVPPSRLKTLWHAREEYVANERAWATLLEPTRAMTDLDDDLINFVIGHHTHGDAISRLPNVSGRGVTVVHDWPLLEILTGLKRDEIRHPAEIERDDGTYVPWPSTLAIARALARMNSRQLLVDVAVAEREEQSAVAHGRRTKYGFETRELAAKMYDEFYKPFFATLRQWAGEESVLGAVEVDFLRQRVGALTDLLNSAVDQLKEAGEEEGAWKLHSALYGGQRRKPDWRSINETRAEEELRRTAERHERDQAPKRTDRAQPDLAERQRQLNKNRGASTQ